MEQTQTALPQRQKGVNWKMIILLQLAILLFACCTLLMKFAAQYDTLSLPWILFYGAGVCILGSYAVIWQQFLKRMPLCYRIRKSRNGDVLEHDLRLFPVSRNDPLEHDPRSWSDLCRCLSGGDKRCGIVLRSTWG